MAVILLEILRFNGCHWQPQTGRPLDTCRIFCRQFDLILCGSGLNLPKRRTDSETHTSARAPQNLSPEDGAAEAAKASHRFAGVYWSKTWERLRAVPEERDQDALSGTRVWMNEIPGLRVVRHTRFAMAFRRTVVIRRRNSIPVTLRADAWP